MKYLGKTLLIASGVFLTTIIINKTILIKRYNELRKHYSETYIKYTSLNEFIFMLNDDSNGKIIKAFEKNLDSSEQWIIEHIKMDHNVYKSDQSE